MNDSTLTTPRSHFDTRDASARVTSTQKRLLSVDEVAVYIGRTSIAVREMIRHGKLRPVRNDGRVMLDRHDLDSWIEAGKQS